MIAVKPTDRLVFDLEMYQIDYNEQKKNALRHQIAEKYGVPLRNIEINFKPITVDANGDKVSLADDIINNIQNPQFQVELFKEYIKSKEIEDIDFEEIEKIDAQVNAFVDYDAYSKYKTYKFKYVKWDNYLSYGSDNYFDFTDLNGLVLLNGYPENQCGKTTFAIDLLRFALFGKADKSPTLDSVFNAFKPEATEVSVEAGIEIEGIDYVIRRIVNRPSLQKRTKKSKCKQTVEYYKIVNNEKQLIENIEAESTTQTNNLIKDAVGTVDDFNLVISATSYSLGDLLRLGQTDKGKLFSRWLGLLSIEKKEEIAKKLWKEKESKNLLSNRYNSSALDEEIAAYNTVIESNNKAIVSSQEKLSKTNENIERYNKEKTLILSSRKEIKEELIKADINTIEHNIVSLNEDLTIKRNQMSQLKEEYKVVKNAKFDIDDYQLTQSAIEEKKLLQGSFNNKNIEIKVKIGGLREDNKRIEKLSEQNICPTCGHKIDINEQMLFISKNKEEESQLIQQGVENKTKIDEIEKEIIELNKKLSQMDEQKEMLNTKQKLELKMTAIKANIDNIKLQIEKLYREKEDINTNKDNIKYNQEIDLKVNNIDISIRTENGIKDENTRNIAHLTAENNSYLTQIKTRKEIIGQLKEEEKIIRHWSLYQELVGKNGIIKIVLKKALPIINNEVDRILNGLCDFKVIMSIDANNKICLDLVKDGVSLDMSIAPSGFETVMSSLALRSALASIGSISKPNFCVFDEILDGVGVSNYENVREVFNRIKGNYQFIIHITHNELIADWHKTTITVTKEDNISVLKLGK